MNRQQRIEEVRRYIERYYIPLEDTADSLLATDTESEASGEVLFADDFTLWESETELPEAEWDFAAQPVEASVLAEAALPAEVPELAEAALPVEVSGLAEAAQPVEASGLAAAAQTVEASRLAEAALPVEMSELTEAALPDEEFPVEEITSLSAEIPVTEMSVPLEMPMMLAAEEAPEPEAASPDWNTGMAMPDAAFSSVPSEPVHTKKRSFFGNAQHDILPRHSASTGSRSIEDRIAEMDETFSQKLLRMIDERNMSDAEAYKKAHVDRRHFSKIRSDADYSPNKKTVLAFSIALHLSPDETGELLRSAGYALSRSSKFDIIVHYFLENRNYDMVEINEILYEYGQPVFA